MVGDGRKFHFRDLTSYDIEKEIKQLDAKKSASQNDIPVKMLHKTSDIISEHLSQSYNKAKNEFLFPNTLKSSDVIPIHKKDEKTLMKNYRPISLIPVVSKIFERNMYNEIMSYIEEHLSPFLFGFRKGHSSEQCLLVMMETWKKALDKKGFAEGGGS